jgi:hypothetical protein
MVGTLVMIGGVCSAGFALDNGLPHVDQTLRKMSGTMRFSDEQKRCGGYAAVR